MLKYDAKPYITNGEIPPITTAPDTAPGQLVHPELADGGKPVSRGIGTPSSDALTISRRSLKALWRDGHLDNSSYCLLALYFDEVGLHGGLRSFDMNAFAVKWSVHWQVEKEKKSKKGASTIEVVDKEKQLTEAQIEAVLGKLEKKEQATVERNIQLAISWE